MAVTSLLLCSTVTLYSALVTATGPYAVSIVPRGSCKLCCAYNLQEDVSFLLYTRRNPRTAHRLYVDGHHELRRSPLRRNSSTIIYIHGFTEVAAGRSPQTIKSAFLSRGDYNVIVVDWSPLAAAPWYRPAADNALPVGRFLARFIHFLHDSRAVHASYLHVVGFSLGAEVAGFAGKALKDIRLPRITGLDPAFPLYMMRDRRGHLVPSDAEFVDVVHTDGGVFGFDSPLGHVDFYPNGGMPFQPGCRLHELVRMRMLRNYLGCSHNRAWALYAESVRKPRAFPAVRCHSFSAFKRGQCAANSSQTLQYMGLSVDPSLRGKFYLRTKDRAPFSVQTGRGSRARG